MSVCAASKLPIRDLDLIWCQQICGYFVCLSGLIKKKMSFFFFFSSIFICLKWMYVFLFVTRVPEHLTVGRIQKRTLSCQTQGKLVAKNVALLLYISNQSVIIPGNSNAVIFFSKEQIAYAYISILLLFNIFSYSVLLTNGNIISLNQNNIFICV